MGVKKTIRCSNHDPQGNILVAIDKDSIFVRCKDYACKRWTRITFNQPGVNTNLSEAGIVTETMPDGYHLHLDTATAVISA